MTTFQGFPIRNRDQQDGFERHIWGSLEHTDAGAIMTVKGTDTEDQEAPVLNIGYGFNVPADTNTEVMLVSLGSDTDQKYAVPTIPRDKQRKWAENSGGIQHPTNGDRAVEINGDEVWLKDGTFKIGNDKEITLTVSGGSATLSFGGTFKIESDVEIEGDLKVSGDVRFEGGGILEHNGVNIGSDHRHSDVQSGPSVTGVPTD